MGLFGGLFKKLGQMVSGQKIDDEFFDRLEEQLILADMGVETAMELVEDMEDTEAVFLTVDGKTLLSSGLGGRYKPTK